MTEQAPNIIIYNTIDGKASVALYAKDGKIWLNQQQIAELFATSKPNISMHISNILKEKELNRDSVVKDFLEGNSRVTNQEMEDYVRTIYADFDSRRKSYEATLADEEDMQLLEKLESAVKDRVKRDE